MNPSLHRLMGVTNKSGKANSAVSFSGERLYQGYGSSGNAWLGRIAGLLLLPIIL